MTSITVKYFGTIQVYTTDVTSDTTCYSQREMCTDCGSYVWDYHTYIHDNTVGYVGPIVVRSTNGVICDTCEKKNHVVVSYGPTVDESVYAYDTLIEIIHSSGCEFENVPTMESCYETLLDIVDELSTSISEFEESESESEESESESEESESDDPIV